MFILVFIFVQFVKLGGSAGWKQLGCNSYGNFRSETMGQLTDWNSTVSGATGAFDMILNSGGYLILQTQKRKDGYVYNGMASLDFNTGEVVSTKSDLYSSAFAGTISKTLDGIYVFANRPVSYNYTTEVIAVNGKLEELWRFNFQRKYVDNYPVAVLPIREDVIIVVNGPYNYPESGIGAMHYSEVYCFDPTGITHGSLKPIWMKEMKRGSVLYYEDNLYFKSTDSMLKVDPKTGNVLRDEHIPYPRVYSNMVVSENQNKMIYNCGLPPYSDPNHNQCALNFDNFTLSSWTNSFSGDHSCFNIALSNDETLVYVQCKFGSWSTNYKIAALDVSTGKIVSNYSYSGMLDTNFRKMSAVVMDDGSVVVPLTSKIIVFDSQLKKTLLTIDWDESMAFYGAMIADNFKCFAYCLSAAGYGTSQVSCHKRCI